MPEMTVKYNKDELEKMLEDLLLRPQGLKLADVPKPIRWHYRPELKVTIHAEVDPDARVPAEPVAQEAEGTERDDPLTETVKRLPPPEEEDLDPTAFPPGTNIAALKNAVKAEEEADKRPLMPGESFERTDD